jgi:hypothetical protein
LTRRIALPFLLLSTTCLLAPACALGTADSGDDGTNDPGDAAGARDTASPDTSSPGFGRPDAVADAPGEAGEGLDAPTSDAWQPEDTGAPGDSGSDSEAADGADAEVDAGRDAGVHDAGVDAGAHDAGIDSGAPDAGIDTGSGCIAHGFSGTLVTFDLSSEPGNEATAPVTSTATGVTSSALGRAAAINPVNGNGSINGDNWGTGASADPTRYYTFTVTPASGCTLDVTSLTYDVRASSTGPANGDVATSVDSFGTHSAAFAGTSTGTASLGATSSGAIEIRVFGFGATSSAGTFRIENTLSLGGNLQ